MGRASDSKKRAIKAREFSAMNVDPFRKDKRKGSLLLGQMKIQRKRMSQPDM
jgi:hypothetical protein